MKKKKEAQAHVQAQAQAQAQAHKHTSTHKHTRTNTKHTQHNTQTHAHKIITYHSGLASVADSLHASQRLFRRRCFPTKEHDSLAAPVNEDVLVL